MRSMPPLGAVPKVISAKQISTLWRATQKLGVGPFKNYFFLPQDSTLNPFARFFAGLQQNGSAHKDSYMYGVCTLIDLVLLKL